MYLWTIENHWRYCATTFHNHLSCLRFAACFWELLKASPLQHMSSALASGSTAVIMQLTCSVCVTTSALLSFSSLQLSSKYRTNGLPTARLLFGELKCALISEYTQFQNAFVCCVMSVVGGLMFVCCCCCRYTCTASGYVTGWATGEPWVNSRQGQDQPLVRPGSL